MYRLDARRETNGAFSSAGEYNAAHYRIRQQMLSDNIACGPIDVLVLQVTHSATSAARRRSRSTSSTIRFSSADIS